MAYLYPGLLSRHLPKLDEVGRISVGVGDTVVHAPGFEDRTMAITDGLSREGDARVLLLEYQPINVKNRLAEVRAGLTAIGFQVVESDIVPYRRFDPVDYEELLRHALIGHRTRRVVLDTSSMSKLAILLSLNVCFELDLDVTVLYTEARQYGPSKSTFLEAQRRNELHRPSIQIYSGVHGVVRVNSLSSVAMQGQPTAALVFMSFNDNLTQVLLNTVYPSRLFLINGRPPVHYWRESATAWIHEQVRREWEGDNPVVRRRGRPPIPRRAISTLDYRRTVSLLLGLYWQLSSTHRILLAPAGSKMQGVACYIVKALHPDIHIEYPSPEGFLDEYSSGIGNRWALNLGSLRRLIRMLSKDEEQKFRNLPT